MALSLCHKPRRPHDLTVGARGHGGVLRRRLDRDERVGVNREAPPTGQVHVVPKRLDVAERVALATRVVLDHLCFLVEVNDGEDTQQRETRSAGCRGHYSHEMECFLFDVVRVSR